MRSTNKIETLRTRIRHPFPLYWGLATLALFLVFVIITQLQFKDLSNERLYQVKLDAYRSEERAYDVAVQAHIDCLLLVETRDTHREIYGNIADIFKVTAELPSALLTNSDFATKYNESLSGIIKELIEIPLETKLPPRDPNECIPIPENHPVRPER